MGFSRYDLGIYVRVAVLFALIMASNASYYLTDFIVTPIMFALMALIATVELVWRLKRLERAWSRFLTSIVHHDFSRSYGEFGEFKELEQAFDLINRSFERLNTQSAADYQLLKTLYQHVKIGLICYKPSGEVIISNQSVLKLLKLSHLTNINDLANDYPKLYNALTQTTDMRGEVITDQYLKKLLIRTEPFALKGEPYRLASIYNLTSTLEINELESYQRLLRVLTHEIMNSSAPILSLIQVVNKKLLDGDEVQSLSDKDQRNIAISLRGIEDRTSGMLNFVNAYRVVNRDISPNKTNIQLTAFMDSLEGQIEGLKQQFPSAKMELKLEATREVVIDPDLMGQVLINLTKNALEATSDKPDAHVSIKMMSQDSLLVITVTDNGEGVNSDAESDMFVPFFTTKKDGSGVGLALSRKIVRAHQGQLTYSRADGITKFEIKLSDPFPQESTS
ncbi:MAG: HAMP domain-containing sensor histidine kinase [Cyclobacteriaceae bacterium]